jgi:hypothetical protein
MLPRPIFHAHLLVGIRGRVFGRFGSSASAFAGAIGCRRFLGRNVNAHGGELFQQRITGELRSRHDAARVVDFPHEIFVAPATDQSLTFPTHAGHGTIYHSQKIPQQKLALGV